jgi:hypothetical protein
VVLVRPRQVNDDFTAGLEVFVAPLEGGLRRVGALDRAFIATTRLDSAASVLYVTRSEDGIHNLFAFDLRTGNLRPATSNRAPGVTFSGVEPAGAGSILGVRTERRSDLFLIERRTRVQ